jgi:hypothetical protein
MIINRLVRGFVPALVLATLPVASFAGIAVGVSINIAPPALPVYVQPAPPGPDFLWTPGYWAWGDDGYYWVPGTWVLAPSPGLLWTPGYWGWVDGAYIWHTGYWGPHVGFYGGVNYGFGYTGVGFAGCFWRSGHVVYNRAVTNVTNINVTNVYNRTVVVNNVSHVSFNGGHGGIAARPTAAQLSAEHERHFDATPMQRQHFEMAAKDRDLRASVNAGRPHIAATPRATSFSGRGVIGARAAGGDFHPVSERNDRPPQAQREGMRSAAAHNEGGHPGAPREPSFNHEQMSHAPQHSAPPSGARTEQHAGSSEPHMARTERPQGPPGGGEPHAQPYMGQPHGQPSTGQPHAAPSMGQPHGQPSMGQPHAAPSMGQPHGQPSMGQPHAAPSMGQPNMGQPHGQPRGEGAHPGGGGGRSEGHEGKGPQNRLR